MTVDTEVIWRDQQAWVEGEPWVHPTGPYDDYQFELDGVVFGRGATIFVHEDGFDPGSAEWRTQDGEVANGDGVTFGRDYLGGPVWAWTLGVDRSTPTTALAEMSRLKQVWQGNPRRHTPGQVAALRYRLAGRTRRVYGRPRSIAPMLNNRLLTGYAELAANFQCADHLTYDETEKVVTTSLVADALGGFPVPFVTPWTSARNMTAERGGSFVVGGDAATWPVIEIKGPISNALVSCLGRWELQVRQPLAIGQTLVIDTRPWSRTVLRNGAGAGGMLGHRTRLQDLQLPPGSQQILFYGSAVQAGATATVRWRDASNSL